jgi:hypothetical protein
MNLRNILKALTGALAAIAVAGMATTSSAQQQEPPQGLVIEVTPQGWLNPPNVPVEGSLPGSMRRQVIMVPTSHETAPLSHSPSVSEKACCRAAAGPTSISARSTDTLARKRREPSA